MNVVQVSIVMALLGMSLLETLSIIKDAKLRSLIEKGPSYREQNYINWSITERLCREAVAEYKRKWSRREKVDIRVLNEWECKVNECVQKRITSLQRKHK